MKSYLTYGDRVTVTGRKSYKGKYFDCTGTVHNCNPMTGGKVGVTLDGLSNPASSHGYFWFAQHELTLLQGEEEKHDTTDKEENSMLIPGYVVARVVFLDDTIRKPRPNSTRKRSSSTSWSTVCARRPP